MNSLHIIGRNVMAIRKLRGLTQEELGKKAGLHKSYIGFVERGERNLSVETIDLIAKALEIQPFLLWMESMDALFTKTTYK
jgi:transcriptional regulator with XRE-family HTH domain